jgi:hypothetical protein
VRSHPEDAQLFRRRFGRWRRRLGYRIVRGNRPRLGPGRRGRFRCWNGCHVRSTRPALVGSVRDQTVLTVERMCELDVIYRLARTPGAEGRVSRSVSIPRQTMTKNRINKGLRSRRSPFMVSAPQGSSSTQMHGRRGPMEPAPAGVAPTRKARDMKSKRGLSPKMLSAESRVARARKLAEASLPAVAELYLVHMQACNANHPERPNRRRGQKSSTH